MHRGLLLLVLAALLAPAVLAQTGAEWIWAGGVDHNSVEFRVQASADTNVTVIVSQNAQFAEGVETATVRQAVQAENQRVLSFTVNGLSPNTLYFYAPVVGGVADLSKSGKFRTFARDKDSFSHTVALSGCIDDALAGQNGVFSTIAGQDPNLLIIAGNLHSEQICGVCGVVDENCHRQPIGCRYQPQAGFESACESCRFVQDVNNTCVENSCSNLSADRDLYRAAYDRVLGRADVSSLLRNQAVAYVWDDKDYGPNDGNRFAPGREAARRTYRERVPHYDLSAGNGNNPIYFSFPVGRTLYIVTDLRSVRDATKEPKSAQFPFGFDDDDNDNPDNNSKTMLGSTQKSWLKRRLREGRDDYCAVVWVNTVTWIGDRESTTRLGDGWWQFLEEREEIADFIHDNNVDNLVMVGADGFMAIDDGSNNQYDRRERDGWPIAQGATLTCTSAPKGMHEWSEGPRCTQFNNNTCDEAGQIFSGQIVGAQQYLLINIEDTNDDNDGNQIIVRLNGFNLGSTIPIVSLAVPFQCSGGSPPPPSPPPSPSPSPAAARNPSPQDPPPYTGRPPIIVIGFQSEFDRFFGTSSSSTSSSTPRPKIPGGAIAGLIIGLVILWLLLVLLMIIIVSAFVMLRDKDRFDSGVTSQPRTVVDTDVGSATSYESTSVEFPDLAAHQMGS